MRLATRTALSCLALGVSACDPLWSPKLLNPPQAENVHLLPRISEQRVARDNCLSAYIAQHDNGQDRIEMVARSASDACAPEDEKLINLLLEMDTDGRPQVTAAVRKDSAFQAYNIALRIRAVPEKRAEPATVVSRPAPQVEWR